MTTKTLKVAFIGTGIMGAPIAGHILDAHRLQPHEVQGRLPGRQGRYLGRLPGRGRP
jgi:pyrroline-5-carboxylate reductase